MWNKTEKQGGPDYPGVRGRLGHTVMPHHRISENHALREFFRSLVHDSLAVTTGLNDRDVEEYLSGLITEFMHADASALVVGDEAIEDLTKMVVAGDVRLGADSFDRARVVHKHIGDYVMFWSGIFPEQTERMRRRGEAAGLVNPVRLGKASYHLVSTFVHGDYAQEAPLFKRLSNGFETYLFALHLVREAWETDGREWSEGFRS
ncbi:MAG: hypothetical protein IH851_09395 [Armatimonadetes bacterium]|nr:hypothetical protein [Armatimonadota bacterium]